MWLIKAVHMIGVEDEPKADWRSYWASLSLEVPAPSELDKARSGP